MARQTNQLTEWRRGDRVTDLRLLNEGKEKANEIIRLWDTVLRRTGLDGNGDGIGQRQFWAEITGNSNDSSNRWTYSFKEKVKNGTGYDGWVDRTNGRIGTAGQSDAAYNSQEDGNSGSGVEMNGVDHSGASFTSTNFAMVPVPTGAKVWMHEVAFVPTADELANPTDPPHNAKVEYWFTYENADDGTC